MAKRVGGDIWIDGFNLFHRWARTRDGFRPQGDIVRAQDEALRALASALGRARGRCTLFMDGGLRYEARTLGGVRIRYPGPGRKADDLILEAFAGRGGGGKVHVVTSDNALAAAVRGRGGGVIKADDFIATYLVSAGGSGDDAPGVEKPPPPDAQEVAYWLRHFDAEDGE